MKKTIASLLTLVLLITCATQVFAGSASTVTTGYGTLFGQTNKTYYVTSVSKNPDNAYLTIKGEIQDRNGRVLAASSRQSARGQTYFAGGWTSMPPNAHRIFGTHGVQGGSTYSAAAVYTASSV